jgi:hypothetical protein
MIAHKGNFGPIVLKKSPKTGKAPIRFEIEIKNRTKTMGKIYPPADEMMIFGFFNTIGEFQAFRPTG